MATIDRLKLGDRPFFLCLGSLTRSKNLTLAVAAIRRVPGARLVIVGGADSSVFRSAGLDLDGAAVVLAGRTSDAEVVGLLRNAAALIFPSRYEGFGIPPLEAMVSDCPVIAADIPAVREVCGEAAIYVSPDSPGDCAAAMARILAEAPADRAQRTAAGQARSALYSWDRTAKELLSIARQMGAVAGTDQSVSAIDCRT